MMNHNSNSQLKNSENKVPKVKVSNNLVISLKPSQISENLVHLLLKN